MKTVYLETLGCSKNRVDSEIMLGTLVGNGFQHIQNSADAKVIIVNTCGFLTSAVSESIERILTLSEHKKAGTCEALIVVGCMVERYKDKLLEELPEIDGVIGTSDYSSILNCINNFFEGRERQLLSKMKPLYARSSFESKRLISTQHYAYVKIAEGCSNNCSFCNIPKLRGRQVSKPDELIVSEIKNLLASGVKEINLISQDSSAYGRDIKRKNGLLELVKRILGEVDEYFWLRIFYSYPNNYPVGLFDIMNQDDRLVPYMDVPFQHISDKVLAAMNRKIKRKTLEKLVDSALTKVNNIALRTTLMVGFPNESEADFKELERFVEKGLFQHLGVFTYSHEDNIDSYAMGDRITEKTKQERKSRLMSIQQKISEQKNRDMVGQTQKVLIEGEYEETELLLQGRNQFQGAEVDGVVLINEGLAEKGQFHEVEITDAHPYDLIGSIIEK